MLVKEHKLHKLIRGLDRKDRLEASGVLLRDQDFYVVFDNLPWIARIEQRLVKEAGTLLGDGYDATGFEDIAFDSHDQLFYMLVEARQHSDDTVQPRVGIFDQSQRRVARARVGFIIENKNKEFEGLVVVRRDNQLYLLGLSEGNRCRGRKGWTRAWLWAKYFNSAMATGLE
jgi:hypothetical protein